MVSSTVARGEAPLVGGGVLVRHVFDATERMRK